MTMPPLNRIVAALPATVPFVGPEALERRRGQPFLARIGANESVFGPSPKAVEAMQRAATEGWMYGDPECHDLRAALAEHHGVEPANIVCGVGIDGLLSTTVRLFVEPGTAVVSSLGGYPTFAFHVRTSGGVLSEVPYRADREDLAGLAERVRSENARVVYVANPDNPMGTWWSAEEIQGLRARLPMDTVLCLDEAYADTAPPNAIPPLDMTDAGVIRFRTFSKAHGLAGLRVGYALGASETIAAFDRVRDHFGVGRVSQAAALASLADQAHLTDVIEQTALARTRIAAIATANGLTPLPAAANFVAVDLGRDGVYARSVLHELGQRGIFLRMPGVAPLDRCIRIGAGLPAQLDLLERELPSALTVV